MMTTNSAERLLKSATAAMSAAKRGFTYEWRSYAAAERVLQQPEVQNRADDFLERRRAGKEPDLDRSDFLQERLAALKNHNG